MCFSVTYLVNQFPGQSLKTGMLKLFSTGVGYLKIIRPERFGWVLYGIRMGSLLCIYVAV
jgi:hypothetical protein